jgi:hypothetical protein
MPPALRIPITNVYGEGDYTAQIKVGSTGVLANVLLDTGSSTLAVNSTVYNPGTDAKMEPTTLAQDIIYDTGGWTGPVVKADIGISSGGQTLSINTYLAVTADSAPGNFGNADGVIGLAFNWLNSAYDLSSYLTEMNLSMTYPWPFQIQSSKVALRQFNKFLSGLPQHDITPYFTVLSNQGVTRNIFAFYTHRSTVTNRTADPFSDPLNNGLFILGGGPEQNDLYTGDFVDVDVVDDMWYNVNLLAVQVAESAEVDAKQLTMQYAKTNISNSIIDSGASVLVLAPDVYAAIMSSLHEVNPAFTNAVQKAQQQQYVMPAASLNLDNWPDIKFILADKNGGPVPLVCPPASYWQLDTPGVGQATFQIRNSNQVQSILGLPLLNNYYTVFDRQQNPYGVVRFAKIAPPP